MKRSPVRKFFLVVTVLCLVVFIGLLWFRYGNTITSGAPEGILYLALADRAPSEAEPQGWTSSYAWSPEDNSFSSFIKDDAHHYLDTVFSPDGSKIATVEVSSFAPAGSPSKIIVTDANQSNKTEYGVSETPVRNPAWSSDGKKIVYTQLVNLDLNRNVPSNWRVYEIDLSNGTEKFITTGINPLFAPNGDLLVLKDNGLNRVTENGSELLWGIEGGTIDSPMRIALSSDGSRMAWTVPVRGQVLTLKVTSWTPFTAEPEMIIPGYSYSTKFSPDGKYLAIQRTVKEEGKEETSNVGIYETETYTPVLDFELNAFTPLETMVTDWR